MLEMYVTVKVTLVPVGHATQALVVPHTTALAGLHMMVPVGLVIGVLVAPAMMALADLNTGGQVGHVMMVLVVLHMMVPVDPHILGQAVLVMQVQVVPAILAQGVQVTVVPQYANSICLIRIRYQRINYDGIRR